MTISQPANQRPKRAWIAPFLLIALPLVVFGYVVVCDFVLLDDVYNIWQNPRLNPPTLESIGYYWGHPEHGLYIPLTYTVWGLLALIAQVSPDPLGVALNPSIFHLANLLLHVASGLVVFQISRRLFPDWRAALVGAMLFSLHPVQVEPVAWAAGLKDVLAGMLALTSIWQYLRFVQDRHRGAYLLGLLAFVAAMISKPSALAVPGLLLAIDGLLIKRPWRDVFRALAPWVALSVVCAIIGRIAQPATGVIAAPLWARPFVVGDALAFYFWKLIYPMHLAVDYGRTPARMIQQKWFYACWLIPTLLLLIGLLNRKRAAEALVGMILFVVALFPVLGFVTFLFQFYSTTADHYLYLAMLGPALFVGWVVLRFHAKPIVLGIASILLILLGTRSMLQTRYWRDDFTLFAHTLQVNPQSFMSTNNIGHAHMIRRQYSEAEAAFRQSVRIAPDYAESQSNLASALEQQGKFAEAIEHRRKGIELFRQRPPEVRPDLTAQDKLLQEDLRNAQ